VIPSVEEVLASYTLLRQRRGGAPASEVAVRAALRVAHDLAKLQTDEPAALLFVFGAYRRAFPAAWRFMAQTLTYTQAHAIGFTLDATPAEVDEGRGALRDHVRCGGLR
jgi:hypothetical protein